MPWYDFTSAQNAVCCTIGVSATALISFFSTSIVISITSLFQPAKVANLIIESNLLAVSAFLLCTLVHQINN